MYVYHAHAGARATDATYKHTYARVLRLSMLWRRYKDGSYNSFVTFHTTKYCYCLARVGFAGAVVRSSSSPTTTGGVLSLLLVCCCCLFADAPRHWRHRMNERLMFPCALPIMLMLPCLLSKVYGSTAEQLKAYSVGITPPQNNWVEVADTVFFQQVWYICKNICKPTRAVTWWITPLPLSSTCTTTLIRAICRRRYTELDRARNTRIISKRTQQQTAMKWQKMRWTWTTFGCCAGKIPKKTTLSNPDYDGDAIHHHHYYYCSHPLSGAVYI